MLSAGLAFWRVGERVGDGRERQWCGRRWVGGVLR